MKRRTLIAGALMLPALPAASAKISIATCKVP